MFFFLAGIFRRVMDLCRLRRYDLVFVHRESSPLGSAIFEKIVFLAKRPIIFDFDDSIFLPNFSDANRVLNFLKNPRKVPKIIKLSRLVIAGNDFLKNYACRYNNNTVIIPTSIDTSKYFPVPKGRGQEKEIVIGWIGSSTTVKYISLIQDALYELIDKFSHLRIHIIGGKFKPAHPSIINKEWSLENEISDLRKFDIGIMPIPDDPWSQGKCAFKIIQYMSMGIPAVASPVGMNAQVIKDGENGFLAKEEREWVDRLTRLINDPQLREKIGAAGRKTVQERYSLNSRVGEFLKLIHSVAAKNPENS
jgi:glycosyltransferase involved in cell wall biosynthesis